jgi:hypothetical protein
MLHLDASDQRFFLRQLEEIEAEMVMIARPELKCRALIPTKFVDPGSTSITYRELDKTGSAKVIASNAKDLPRVDVFGKEFTKPIRVLGDSYAYTYEEIRRAAKAGEPLDRERAETAREVLMRKEDEIAWLGSSADGLEGLAKHSAPTATNAPNGAGASPLWANKTGFEIIKDMTDLVAAIRQDTMGIHTPNALLMPEESLTLIAQKPMSNTGDSTDTVLSFFMKTNPFIKSVDPLFHLSTAGASSNRRLMAYNRDPRFVKMHLVDYAQLPPQEQGLESVINCFSKTAGVTLYYPKVVRYLDGI